MSTQKDLLGGVLIAFWRDRRSAKGLFQVTKDVVN